MWSLEKSFVAWEGTPHDPTSLRSRAVACLAVLHFSKRTLECICLHEYSGTMPLFSSLMISSFYLLVAGFSVHYASVVPAALLQDWTPAAGLLLFCVGQLGNLCHHYLLATLRRPGERVYKVPRGGLFEYVVWRLLLLLEQGHAGCFLADLCDPRRFDGLPLQAVTAAGRGRMFGDGRAVPTTP